MASILIIDDDGLVTMWNGAAARMFGFGALEVMGRRLHDLIAPGRYLPAHQAAFPHFRETGQGAAVGKTRRWSGTPGPLPSRGAFWLLCRRTAEEWQR